MHEWEHLQVNPSITKIEKRTLQTTISFETVKFNLGSLNEAASFQASFKKGYVCFSRRCARPVSDICAARGPNIAARRTKQIVLFRLFSVRAARALRARARFGSLFFQFVGERCAPPPLPYLCGCPCFVLRFRSWLCIVTPAEVDRTGRRRWTGFRQ